MKKAFFTFCVEGAVLSFNVAASAALVPSIARDFALSPFFVGKIVWLYMLPYGLAALLYGPLVRVFDAKKVEIACMFLFSLANLLAAFSPDIGTLFAARFCMGLFGASVIPLAIIVIARHVEAKHRGRYIGIFFSVTFVASLLGLLLSGFLPWRQIFLIPGVLGIILTGHMFFYLPSFQSDCSGFRIDYVRALKEIKVFTVFIYIFCISLIYHGIQQWLGVYYAREIGLEQFAISVLITLTSLSGVFGEALGGILSDTLGRIKTMNLGVCLMGAVVFALIFKFPYWISAGLMFVWGLGWTLNHAGVSTVLTDMPQEYLHEAASLNSGVRFLSGGLGTAASGLIMRRNFSLGFIIFGIALVGLMFLSRTLVVERAQR